MVEERLQNQILYDDNRVDSVLIFANDTVFTFRLEYPLYLFNSKPVSYRFLPLPVKIIFDAGTRDEIFKLRRRNELTDFVDGN